MEKTAGTFLYGVSVPTLPMSDFELIRRQLDERLAPPHSLQIEAERIRQAAVTLLLREERGLAELLIIKRSERDGDPWSGHLALPGGRAEPQDADLLITAARETFEEVGIDLLGPDGSRDRFIGQLPLIAPTNPGLPRIEITPLVALAPRNLTMTLSGEVGATFWIPVQQFQRDGLSATHSFRYGDLLFKRSAYPTEGGLVWGITERILTDFLALLRE
jgi:8-oxo-dGTP pyrophosphatase MutT (NUDIX family)